MQRGHASRVAWLRAHARGCGAGRRTGRDARGERWRGIQGLQWRTCCGSCWKARSTLCGGRAVGRDPRPPDATADATSDAGGGARGTGAGGAGGGEERNGSNGAAKEEWLQGRTCRPALSWRERASCAVVLAASGCVPRAMSLISPPDDSSSSIAVGDRCCGAARRSHDATRAARGCACGSSLFAELPRARRPRQFVLTKGESNEDASASLHDGGGAS
jgi:hypothetical protein